MADVEGDRGQRGPVRDFVGYGRRPPAVRWPDDAGVVVNVVINY